MSKRLRVVVLAGLVATALAGRGEAETIKHSSLGCGADECVTIWTFTCPAAKTTFASAWVCPVAPGAQFFNVTIVGRTPSSLAVKGDIHAADYEECAGPVHVMRHTPGPISGYVTVSLWSQIGGGGAGDYRLAMACLDKNGAATTNPSVQKRTAQ